MLSRLVAIDRHYIFLIMGTVVVLPFLLPITFTAKPSEQTLEFVDALDVAIQKDGPIFIELAFGNQTVYEMEPIALSVMHHLFAAKKKVVFFTTYETAAAFTRRYLANMEKAYGLVYGKDFAFLGFAAAYTIAMYKMGTSIEEVFHKDDRGHDISTLPIMSGVRSLKDASALIDIAANSNPRFWINFAVEPHGITLLMAATAVDATNYFPFLQTGQVKGLIAGGRAGAEYESILRKRGIMKSIGDGTRALGSQSLSLLVIIAFILIGNIGYFAGRGSRRRP
jgi:hypothetical protein